MAVGLFLRIGDSMLIMYRLLSASAVGSSVLRSLNALRDSVVI